jgi:hypothetical protein
MPNSQTTSLTELLNDDSPNQQQHQQQQQQQHQQHMEQQQHQQHMEQQQMQQPHKTANIKPGSEVIHNENSQSAPDAIKRKEFFGFTKDVDIKSSLLVFFIIILISGIYMVCPRTSAYSMIGPEGKPTPFGTGIAALIGALIFMIAKMIGKF